jgi:hypothetical protein
MRMLPFSLINLYNRLSVPLAGSFSKKEYLNLANHKNNIFTQLFLSTAILLRWPMGIVLDCQIELG